MDFRDLPKDISNLKYSIMVTKLNISSMNNLVINDDFKSKLKYLNDERKFLMSCLNQYNKYTITQRIAILKWCIHMVNSLFNLPKNMLTNYTINQYCLNNNPTSVNMGDLYITKCDPNTIAHITFILLALLYNGQCYSFETFGEVMEFINNCLNLFQGFSIDIKTASKQEIKQFIKSSKEFRNLCDRLNVEPESAYKYMRLRNCDYENQYMMDLNVIITDAFNILYSDSNTYALDLHLQEK